MNLLRVLHERPFIVGAASLLLAFGGAYAMFQWAVTSPTKVLVGRAGLHDAKGTPPEPLAQCLDCHVPFRGTPPTRCLAPGCHGALATGTPPRAGPAMPVRFHAALRGHQCGTCHHEHGRPAVRHPVFTHRAIPTPVRSRCPVCHPSHGVENHARTDAISCGLCHNTERWTGASMVHERVRHACDLCHRTPDDPRHASVAGNCQDCHETSRFDRVHPAEK